MFFLKKFLFVAILLISLITLNQAAPPACKLGGDPVSVPIKGFICQNINFLIFCTPKSVKQTKIVARRCAADWLLI